MLLRAKGQGLWIFATPGSHSLSRTTTRSWPLSPHVQAVCFLSFVPDGGRKPLWHVTAVCTPHTPESEPGCLPLQKCRPDANRKADCFHAVHHWSNGRGHQNAVFMVYLYLNYTSLWIIMQFISGASLNPLNAASCWPAAPHDTFILQHRSVRLVL